MHSSKAIWVLGCLRSGTHWYAKMIKPYVSACFLECFQFYPMEQRPKLSVHKSFVFKASEDFGNVDNLLKMYPNSKFVWATRDLRDVVHSIMWPNPKSQPTNVFPYVHAQGYDEVTKFVKSCELALMYTSDAMVMEKYPEAIRVDYDKMIESYETECKRMFAFLEIDGVPPKETRPVKVNYKKWTDWSNEHKRIFKSHEINEYMDKLGYTW